MIREVQLSDSKALKEICSKDLGYLCDELLIKKRISNLDTNRECVFVAEINGEVLGFIHVERYDVLYYSSMANILGLAVSQKSRRQGLGKMLIQAAEGWATKNEISELRLNSGVKRKEAHMFYRNLGFNNEKKQLRFIKKL